MKKSLLSMVVAGVFCATPSLAADEIRIGNIAPYSGPASSFSTFAKVEAAYFKMLNAKGGINGRQIKFISYDDGYSPPKTVEQARRLVEDDDVLLIFHSVGSQTNAAIQKYMNIKKVPQLFIATGAGKFADPKNYPWTMPFTSTIFALESAIYARYIKENNPTAKIGVLFQNDDYGRDYLKGLKDALGADADRLIVATEPYDVKEPLVDSQLARLKAAGVDVFVNFSTPRFTALAIRRLGEMQWRPVHMIANISSNINLVLKPAGIENAKGILTASSLKEPADPRWSNDSGVKEYLSFMATHYPEGDPNDFAASIGFIASQALQKVLEQSGNDLSRENVMNQATNLKNVELGMLLPGITINTSKTGYFPMKKMQLLRFNGAGWDSLGDPVADATQ
jgi:branched-chain amino acid transport system substrate-binding protein